MPRGCSRACCIRVETQQLLVDFAAQHSVHALVKEKPGRTALTDIKLMKDDPAGVEKAAEEIKARYAQHLQGVRRGAQSGAWAFICGGLWRQRRSWSAGLAAGVRLGPLHPASTRRQSPCRYAHRRR